MRILFLLAVAARAEPDPCQFLGARTLKLPSKCIEEKGFCENLFVRERGGRKFITRAGEVQVTCVDAMEQGSEILVDFQDQSVTNTDVSSIISAFENSVNPNLHRAVFLGESGPEANDAMNLIDATMIMVMIKESETTTDEKLLLIRESHTYKEFIKLMDIFLEGTLAVPLKGAASRIAVMQRYIQFTFDLMSYLPRPEERLMWGLRSLIRMDDESKLYRPLHFREFIGYHRPESLLETPEGALAVSQAIDLWAGRRAGGKFDDLFRFLNEVTSANAAATAIVEQHIRSAICPRVLEIVRTSTWDNISFTCATSALQLCANGPEVRRQDIILASVDLRKYALQFLPGLEDGPNDLVISDALYREAAAALMNGDIGWMTRTNEGVTDLVVFFENVINELNPVQNGFLKPATAFPSWDIFARTMGALGRMLGLYFWFNFNLGTVFRLEPLLIKAIHSDQPLDHLSTILDQLPGEGRSQDEMLLQFVYEPVVFIRIGINDVLGPAGISAFPLEQWSALFLEPTD